MDGRSVDAWASHKGLQPKGSLGRGRRTDFHGQRRNNETHPSKTDPTASLYRKSNNAEARLAYLGNALTENRHRLVVEATATQNGGTAVRDAAELVINDHATNDARQTMADKNYDTNAK